MEYHKTNKINLDVFLRAKAVLEKEGVDYKNKDHNMYFEENGISYKYSFNTNRIEEV